MPKTSILNRAFFPILMLSTTLAWGQSRIVKPTPAQVEWQKMEINLFCHFGPNTFTGNEWGDGHEPDSLFNPSALDCRQWVSVARQAGMKGIIITAKHHDGFCLWPSATTTHTVANSPWRGGKGDVLQELSEACHEGGLRFGVYTSPWDRNHPSYGSDAYNSIFLQTLDEVHTRYGDVFEQWFDGACGEGPNGKRQRYDWDAFNGRVLSHHPNASIFSDVGPGCRWMGNESGVNGATCWSTLNLTDKEGNRYEPGSRSPSQAVLNRGEADGQCWIPAETDVSIRPGWFWRASEHPKSLQQLLSIYYTSVGRNSLLLLNVPPDKRGLIDAEDSVRLVEFRHALDTIFAHNLAKKATVWCNGQKTRKLTDGSFDTYFPNDSNLVEIRLHFRRPVTFNRLLLQEYIPEGQRAEAFSVSVRQKDENTLRTIACETTIGYKRIAILPLQTDIVELVVKVRSSMAPPLINAIGLYHDRIFDDTQLAEETIHRTTDNLIKDWIPTSL